MTIFKTPLTLQNLANNINTAVIYGFDYKEIHEEISKQFPITLNEVIQLDRAQDLLVDIDIRKAELNNEPTSAVNFVIKEPKEIVFSGTREDCERWYDRYVDMTSLDEVSQYYITDKIN